MAQPIIDFTDNLVEDGNYENIYEEGGETYFKDILRFCVYVETDYDTDRDGKNDLVQALVEVPTAAVKHSYLAPTLFHASPYMAGASKKFADDTFNFDKDPGEFKEEDLYTVGTARIPVSP